MTELGKACLEYRARHDMSQKSLAEKCRLERTVIWKVENGKPISKLTEAKVRLAIEEEA